MSYPPPTWPPITWSYSALNQILRGCSLQFYLQRLRALEEDRVSANMALGTAVHDAHAFARTKQITGEDVELGDLIETFDASFAAGCLDERLAFPKGHDQESLTAQGRALVEVMFEHLDDQEVLAVEQEFGVPLVLPNGERRILTGFFDAVVRGPDGVTTVIDLKTAGASYGALKVEQDLQATAYHYAGRALYGEEVRFAFAVLVKTKTPKYEEVFAYRDQSDFDRLAALVQMAEEMIEKGIFFPSESWICGGCGYRAACAEWGRRRLPMAQPTT